MNDGSDDQQAAADEDGADALWAFDPDDDEPTKRSALPLVLLAIGALALVAVLVAVLAGGDDDQDASSGSSTTLAAAGGQGSDQQGASGSCLRWPSTVDAFGEPAVASTPGIHVWFGYDGWKVRRVPGEGVTGAVVTIVSTNPDEPVGSGAMVGLASAAPGEAGAVVITLPGGDEGSEAAFDVPFYASGVVIDFKDEAGIPIPVDQITGGGTDGPIPANPLTAERAQVTC